MKCLEMCKKRLVLQGIYVNCDFFELKYVFVVEKSSKIKTTSLGDRLKTKCNNFVLVFIFIACNLVAG